MQPYSSKDFGRTEATIRVDMPAPDKLIHRDVERTNRDEQFSHERKHPVFVADLPSRVLSVTIGGLEPNQNRSATSSCRYVACENAPMLQNLGVAIREEAR
jgi:hypothetical protein